MPEDVKSSCFDLMQLFFSRIGHQGPVHARPSAIFARTRPFRLENGKIHSRTEWKELALANFKLPAARALPPDARPAPAEHRRFRIHRLPAEEMVLAGPGVHDAATDAAFEAAGM